MVLKALLAPLLILLATLAGRRWGPGVGGWLAGLPLTSGPVSLILALEQGPEFAARAALAGWVVDNSGASAGYAVAALSGYLATVLALACRPGRPVEALKPVGPRARSALRVPAVPAAPDSDHPPAEAGRRGRDCDQHQR